MKRNYITTQFNKFEADYWQFNVLLHLFKKVGVRSADRKGVGWLFESQNIAAGHGTAYAIDAGNIYNGGTMNTPEDFRIQLGGQLFDRFFD